MKRSPNSNLKNTDIIKSYLKGERPITFVGYEAPAEQKHAVGEKWTDNLGKEWEQKENGPVRVTRIMDIVRAELNDICSCCGAEVRWGSKLDRKMYYKTRKCFDCLIKEETILRACGQYRLYERKKMLENEMSYLKEIKRNLREAYEYTKGQKVITYAASDGSIEEWKNETRRELLTQMRADFKTCLQEITRVASELQTVNGTPSRS